MWREVTGLLVGDKVVNRRSADTTPAVAPFASFPASWAWGKWSRHHAQFRAGRVRAAATTVGLGSPTAVALVGAGDHGRAGIPSIRARTTPRTRETARESAENRFSRLDSVSRLSLVGSRVVVSGRSPRSARAADGRRGSRFGETRFRRSGAGTAGRMGRPDHRRTCCCRPCCRRWSAHHPSPPRCRCSARPARRCRPRAPG